MNILKKSYIRVFAVTLGLLIIPVFGNFFVDGWNWNVGDFIFAFVMISGTGLLIEYAVKKIDQSLFRLFVVVGIVAAFLVVWVALATG